MKNISNKIQFTLRKNLGSTFCFYPNKSILIVSRFGFWLFGHHSKYIDSIVNYSIFNAFIRYGFPGAPLLIHNEMLTNDALSKYQINQPS